MPRVDRAGGVALAAALGVLAAASSATATCPPLRSAAGLLERLAAEHPNRTPPLSQRGLLEQRVSPLIVTPPSGPAPLDVEIRWFHYPYPDVARFDFDLDGDGTVDASEPMAGDHYPRRQHRFTRPGRYTVTVHVRSAAGAVTTLREPVDVFAPDAFDRELQARWSTLKAALRRRDVPAAMECIVGRSRPQYEEVFRELFVKTTSTDVDRVLTSIRPVTTRRAAAIYEMVRTQDGHDRSYEVRFAIDADLVWRIEAF
jgi:hypothetical protein